MPSRSAAATLPWKSSTNTAFAGATPPSSFERELEDARIGLAQADVRRVDHGIEELGERQQCAPAFAELAHVVGDDRGLAPAGARQTCDLDHVGAHGRARQGSERFEDVDAMIRRAELLDGAPRVLERHLAALEPVPGMIGVAVVGAEDQLEDAVGADPLLRAEGAHRGEGRVEEDSTEVEENGVDRHGDIVAIRSQRLKRGRSRRSAVQWRLEGGLAGFESARDADTL